MKQLLVLGLLPLPKSLTFHFAHLTPYRKFYPRGAPGPPLGLVPLA